MMVLISICFSVNRNLVTVTKIVTRFVWRSQQQRTREKEERRGRCTPSGVDPKKCWSKSHFRKKRISTHQLRVSKITEEEQEWHLYSDTYQTRCEFQEACFPHTQNPLANIFRNEARSRDLQFVNCIWGYV